VSRSGRPRAEATAASRHADRALNTSPTSALIKANKKGERALTAPEPFATALRAAKRQLDPAGILNPGVLVD
jgi:FAD/FMN-containing dehydrogenase